MLAAVAIIFGAGIVRGYAGFGFSALSVAGLALLVSPAKIVPAIFVLEVLASISLLRSAARIQRGIFFGSFAGGVRFRLLLHGQELSSPRFLLRYRFLASLALRFQQALFSFHIHSQP